MSMAKISGFSLVRNGIQFDYPFLESWRSLLPLVDELILNVGVSDDASLVIAQKFASEEGQGKVKIFETVWPLHDPEKKKSGIILSEQTNLALDRCTHDWCFYLQADEVLHEEDYPKIRAALAQAEAQKSIEAIVFEYCHFYGSFNVIQKTRSAYRREMRLIRKSSGARSVGDAQSFRKSGGEKLTALLSTARIFHYGWVRTPEAMREKTVFMDQLYHGDKNGSSTSIASTGARNASTEGGKSPGVNGKSAPQKPHTGDNYLYKRFWGLLEYSGSHPTVMKKRIAEKGWNWDLKKSPFIFSASDLKKVALDLYERFTHHRPFEFKNYILRRPS
jgi:hypothetical protein